MSTPTHVRKNDNVLVIRGKDAGKRGKVLKIFPDNGRVIIEKVNVSKRHTRPNPGKGIKGGIAERESPIHGSNVMLVCPECDRPTRIKRDSLEDGTKVRICRKCGATIS